MLRIPRLGQMSRIHIFLLAILCVSFLFFFPLPSFPSVALPYKTSNSSARALLPLTGKPTHNYAFTAFLAAPAEGGDDDNDDLYFVGTRILIYQLLHDPETRTNNSYPFVVLVTEDVCMFSNLSSEIMKTNKTQRNANVTASSKTGPSFLKAPNSPWA
jgi:hypothetical protein